MQRSASWIMGTMVAGSRAEILSHQGFAVRQGILAAVQGDEPAIRHR
jgi:hypothetical protein